MNFAQTAVYQALQKEFPMQIVESVCSDIPDHLSDEFRSIDFYLEKKRAEAQKRLEEEIRDAQNEIDACESELASTYDKLNKLRKEE